MCLTAFTITRLFPLSFANRNRLTSPIPSILYRRDFCWRRPSRFPWWQWIFRGELAEGIVVPVISKPHSVPRIRHYRELLVSTLLKQVQSIPIIGRSAEELHVLCIDSRITQDSLLLCVQWLHIHGHPVIFRNILCHGGWTGMEGSVKDFV